jgi:chloramphenicol 3-O-phosphotransferase
MTAAAIVITGASSTGKSTVAVEVQRLADRPIVFLSGDAMDLPQDAACRAYLRSLPKREGQRLQEGIYKAFYTTLQVWVTNGVSVIGEALFKSTSEIQICEAALASVPHFIVRLVCREDVRSAREAARGDRVAGTTVATAAAESIPAEVALELDTSEITAIEAAQAIVILVNRATDDSDSTAYID